METTVMKLEAVSSVNSPTLSSNQAEFVKQFEMLPVRRMDELVESQTPALNMVDIQALTISVASCIGDYLNFLGLAQKMNDKQIYETAQMMIDAHPHVTVDSIKTFFYRCKKGEFGYHYDGMNGTRILMWFDKFVEEYYKQIDDMEYAKHLNTKGDLASPIALETEENEPIDMDELYASFHGKTKEQLLRERKEKEIRFDVLKENKHLYDSMPVEEADKLIEQAIINRLQQEGLITF